MSKLANYRVIGPNGQGPFEVQAASSMEAVQAAIQQHPEAFRKVTGLNQPQGPHGAVIGYEAIQRGQVAAKIGAFDLTWLGWVDKADA